MFKFCNQNPKGLTNTVQTAIYDSISQTPASELSRFKRDPEHTLVTTCYNLGILTDQGLRTALILSTLKQAELDYQILVTPTEFTSYGLPLGKSIQTPPDHLLYPEVFAFGIERNHFERSALKEINFKPYSPESFVEEYGNPNLLEKLKKSILNPDYNPFL